MRLLAIVLVVLAGCPPALAQEDLESRLLWKALPALPDDYGFGGPFVGVHGEALIVAGGANFSERPLVEGGPKIWHDDVFVLEPGESQWKVGGHLPRPLAYGGAASTPGGLVIVGGSDADQVYADAWRLTWSSDSRSLDLETLPPLPMPMAFGSAEAIGETVYVLAGKTTKDDVDVVAKMWSLDLSAPELAWRERSPCPGPPRFKMVTAVQRMGDGRQQLFAFSGSRTGRGEDGNPTFEMFTDGHRYDPATDTWQAIAPLPVLPDPRPLDGVDDFAHERWPINAASAAPLGPTHIVVFSGSTGRYILDEQGRVRPPEVRPDFARRVLTYHTITDTWTELGRMPTGVVTTRAVVWNDLVVVPSGETRPGIRTPAVQALVGVDMPGSFGVWNSIVVAIYLAAMIAMGFYFARREKTTGDFFLGGRRVPWWAVGLSIFGTQLSAITFLAIPAKTYATDWVYFLQNLGILAIAPLVVACYLPAFRRQDVTTAYEVLERRFHLSVRLFGALSFVVFQLARLGIVLFLPALALAAVTGLNIEACILLMGVLCTLYTLLGGIEAVIWTDVLQVFVLLGGALIALLIVVLGAEGGAGGVLELANGQGKLRLVDGRWDWTMPTLGVILLGAVFNNLVPYTSDQAVVQRYLTTVDERRAARAIWTGALLSVPASLLFFAVGTALFAFYSAHPDRLNPTGPTDQIFAWFIAHELPVGIAGLVVAGIFAASMSSLDSSLNSLSAVITHDLYRRFRPDRTERHYLAGARWITAVLGTLGTATAIVMAQYPIQSLWDRFLSWAGLLGGTLAGLFALAVLSRRATTTGAWCGALAAISALVFVRTQTQLSGLLYAAIGLGTCFVVGSLVSRLTPAREASAP